MAMTVIIDERIGVATNVAVSSVTFNREDTVNGTSPVPIPTVDTVFSWVKSFFLNITAFDGLEMSNILFGKRTAESTGMKFWKVTSHSGYTQAVATPGGTSGNNATGPTIAGATGTLLDLITVPPSNYAAGPFPSGGGIGQKGNVVEVCIGVDPTVTQSGAAVVLPNMVWQWTES